MSDRFAFLLFGLWVVAFGGTPVAHATLPDGDSPPGNDAIVLEEFDFTAVPDGDLGNKRWFYVSVDYVFVDQFPDRIKAGGRTDRSALAQGIPTNDSNVLTPSSRLSNGALLLSKGLNVGLVIGLLLAISLAIMKPALARAALRPRPGKVTLGLLMALLVLSYIHSGSHSYVILDNARDATAYVQIDDGETLTLEPTSYARVVLSNGVHRVSAWNDDRDATYESHRIQLPRTDALNFGMHCPVYNLFQANTYRVAWAAYTVPVRDR